MFSSDEPLNLDAAGTITDLSPLFGGKLTVHMKRLDLIHPVLGGNKFYKLKYIIKKIQEEGQTGFITFGGAYSNHIAASALTAKLAGLKSTGIIRGEKYDQLNPTLSFAEKCGMKLVYISRSDYKQRYSEKYQDIISKEFDNLPVIPEGGSNILGVKGASEILNNNDFNYDYYSVPAGSGGTAAGLAISLPAGKKLIVYQVLKAKDIITEKIESFCSEMNLQPVENYEINTGYHFGGFGKFSSELIEFIISFEQQTGVLVDPVYNGKMLFGLFDQIKSGYFPESSKILVINTGGGQGWSGFLQKEAKNCLLNINALLLN